MKVMMDKPVELLEISPWLIRSPPRLSLVPAIDSVPPPLIWSVAPPDTVQAAVAVMVCPSWMTNVSPAEKLPGAEPPPAGFEFQFPSTSGEPLPWE